MELKDNFGQTTLLKFSALTENAPLKPELFSFTPPKGADVLNGL
jgi:outer membrane lipoprotein carrier protein